MTPGAERLLRELAPQVLGALVRGYGGFDRCEDAVQEALLAAAVQWPGEGLPDNHRVDAVRAHLLDLAGDREAARACYRAAARRTLSIPERRYLESRAD